MRSFPIGLLAAFVVLSYGLAITIDLVVLDRALLDEGIPSFDPIHWLRTSLVALGSACVIMAIAGRRREPDETRAARWRANWDEWGTIRWFPHSRTGTAGSFPIPVRSLVSAAVALLSVGFVVVFIARPGFFSTMGREGQPIELLSALLLFVSCAVFLRVAFQQRHRADSRALFFVSAAGLAIVFFLMAMEEVSWFQHLLGFDTPSAFAGNGQGEMNLHNYATTTSENLYYAGAFALLVMIPFFLDHGGDKVAPGMAATFGPSPFILLTSAHLAAFNYDMWDGVLTQAMFFLMLFILVVYGVTAWRTPERWLIFLVGTVFLLSQSAFLLFGDRFVRLWDVTEYKELLIPLGILVYAFEVQGRMKTEARPATVMGEERAEPRVLPGALLGGGDGVALPALLRQRLRLVAEAEGVSVDQFITAAVVEKISESAARKR